MLQNLLYLPINSLGYPRIKKLRRDNLWHAYNMPINFYSVMKSKKSHRPRLTCPLLLTCSTKPLYSITKMSRHCTLIRFSNMCLFRRIFLIMCPCEFISTVEEYFPIATRKIFQPVTAFFSSAYQQKKIQCQLKNVPSIKKVI